MRKDETEREMFCVCAYVWMYVCEGFSDSQWGYYWLYSSIISQRLACGTYSWLVHWVSSWADLISTFEFSPLSTAQNRHYIQPTCWRSSCIKEQRTSLTNLWFHFCISSDYINIKSIVWKIWGHHSVCCTMLSEAKTQWKPSSSRTDHFRVGDIFCAFPSTVSTFLPLSSPFLSYGLLCPWLCGSRVPICLAS